jgi:hypothetical protein
MTCDAELDAPRAHRRLARAVTIGTLAVALSVIGGAVAAFAYWVYQDATNFYTAHALGATLSAPSAPTTTVNGSESITVGWTLPSTQLVGAQYQVTQTSPGSPSTVCTVASTVSSCNDTGLAPGTTYNFSIRAVISSWQSSLITASATTSTPTLNISLAAGPYTAGSPISLTQLTATVSGLVDTTYSGTKTLTWSSLSSSPSGALPSYPSSTVSFVNGVATTLTPVTVVTAGSSTLTVSDNAAPSVTGTTSITVNVAATSQLSFLTSPQSSSSGYAFPIQPVVAVQDAYGNTETTDSSTVTLSIANGTPSAGGPGTLSGCSQSETLGIVTFTGCAITNTGSSYALTASDGALSSSQSDNFDIAGSADHLVLANAPSSSTSAVSFAQQPVYDVEDPLGHIVTDDISTITLGISPSSPTLGGPGTLSGCSQSETLGVITFSGCTITGAGHGYTLDATDGLLTGSTSPVFNVAGTATQLVVTTTPAGAQGGSAFATQPVVNVEDAYGSTVTTDSSSATLSITPGTPSSGGPGSLSSCSQSESFGVISFSGCRIDTSGVGYSLSASDGSLTAAVSSTFNVTVGPAMKLAVVSAPSSASGGTSFATQPKFAVQDAGGNVVTTNSSTISLSITSGTPSSGGPGTLANCTQSESAGVISFAGCSINTAGVGYQLSATDGTLSSVNTSAFTVSVGPAAKLIFTTSPSSSSGAASFTTQPVVVVEDAGGNVVSTDASTVTLSITTGTPSTGGPGTLSGCSQVESLGTVTFSGCSINTAGSGYSLTAHDGSLTSAVSSTFNVVVGTATQLVFQNTPAGATGGTAFTTQPKVAVEDAGGNVVTTDSSTVSLAITTGTPSTGGPGTLSSCAPSETLGVVTFTGCKINTSGTGYKLTATDGSLSSATSSAFNVTVGAAKLLAFTATPGATTSAVVFSPQPQVAIEDAGGNVVTSSSASVTLAISSGTGTLACTTNPLTAVSGYVNFAGCKITLGTDGSFALKATATSLTTATSSSFTVYGVATKLIITTQPSAGTSATVLSVQPVVSVEDAAGHVVPTATSTVTLAVTSGTGTLSCTTNPVTAVAGVATFAGCQVTLGTQGSFTLTASATGLTSATSSAFTIAGAATKVVFTTQPTASTGGSNITVQPVAKIEDSSGDVVTTSTAAVTLAVASGSGTLSCTTNPVTSVAGVATFAGCKITLGTQGSFTLSAAATGLTSATSSSFTVAGTATQVVFTTQPTASTGGSNLTAQPVAKIEDSSGDVVTTSTAAVTLAVASGTGTLSCTTNPVTSVAGVATFAGCKITLGTQGSFTLSAAATGLTSATSSSFTVAGTATQVVFSAQPGASTGSSAFTVQPVAKIEDSSGDVVTTSTAAVTLAVASGTGTLSCTTNPVTSVAGVATFAGCKITLGTQGSFTLSAAATGLTSATSSNFTVAGTASKLVFVAQPGASTGATAFAVQPVVWIEDSSGDLVTTGTTSTTLAILSGSGTLACTTNPLAAVGGIVTYAGCKITLGTQGNFSLKATGSTYTQASSSVFTVAGSASKLVFGTQPVGAAHGTTFATQPVLYVEDSSGDLVTTSVASVTLSITSGTGTSGAVLSCTTNPLTASAGIISFTGCSIDLAGTNYTLSATATGLSTAVSSTFTMS